jgi:hypothetical protein
MKYRYTMKITPEKIAQLIENAIGRSPDSIGRSGQHTFTFTFDDTDITAPQRADALAAMPEWIRVMYSFTREILPDDQPA